MSGHRDVGISLLQAGADINAQDKDGKTALMIAIINGHQALLDVLLKKNADIKLKNEVPLFSLLVKHQFDCWMPEGAIGILKQKAF